MVQKVVHPGVGVLVGQAVDVAPSAGGAAVARKGQDIPVGVVLVAAEEVGGGVPAAPVAQLPGVGDEPVETVIVVDIPVERRRLRLARKRTGRDVVLARPARDIPVVQRPRRAQVLGVGSVATTCSTNKFIGSVSGAPFLQVCEHAQVSSLRHRFQRHRAAHYTS